MAFNKPHTRQKRIDLAQIGEAGDIAVLITDGFAASDLTDVATAAERSSYRTVIVSPNKSLVSGRSASNEEMNFVVDAHPGDRGPEAFSGLLIPGGAHGLTRLIEDQDARLLIQAFIKAGKPVLAMAEAAPILAEAAGKTPGEAGQAALALRGDLFAAGGEEAREDAISTFIKTLDMVEEAA
ncbi:DJ-1/PfpI family protein [Alkalicaulis satelles]|uniref:DJ-1/PfpI family protein n=1 Tax=Alkalicaulis satelles TaxID=2609175 RepID=UPI0018ECE25E|nr:DJ-1/PfpI family protein [Alkalicaulis satelles]